MNITICEVHVSGGLGDVNACGIAVTKLAPIEASSNICAAALDFEPITTSYYTVFYQRLVQLVLRRQNIFRELVALPSAKDIFKCQVQKSILLSRVDK